MKTCSQCGGSCFAEDDTCQGPVDAIDEINWEDEDGLSDWVWIHACEKHAETYNG